MDRTKANKLFELYERPVLQHKSGKGPLIVFAREDITDVEQIEKMPEKELIAEWKGLVWINNIYGQVCLSELQRIQLIELEFDARKFSDSKAKKLRAWFDQAREKRQKEEEIEIAEYEKPQRTQK